jgi:hypothetical protein
MRGDEAKGETRYFKKKEKEKMLNGKGRLK